MSGKYKNRSETPAGASYENFWRNLQSASRRGTTCSMLLRRVSPIWKEVIISSHPVVHYKSSVPSLRTSWLRTRTVKWYSRSGIRSLAPQKQGHKKISMAKEKQGRVVFISEESSGPRDREQFRCSGNNLGREGSNKTQWGSLITSRS